eukprot:TRINITY_DN3757_c0_g1_i1.p1 TRINITY_DN3757_c0_g1~~TRINITY_DN3757_c0_g1_i1.p1  ORF type:complete len:373 (-),score=98.58 TRINITY_DN3757_c0_g1_i1:38-1156(-)
MAEEEVLIEVTWENQPKAQAKLRVQASATLRDMHNALVGAKPIFETKEYIYIYEDKPIFREFWDVFEAKNFNKRKLFMRPGSYKINHTGPDSEEIIPVPLSKGKKPAPAPTGPPPKASAGSNPKPVSAPAPEPAVPVIAKPEKPAPVREEPKAARPAPGKLQPMGINPDLIVGGLQKNAAGPKMSNPVAPQGKTSMAAIPAMEDDNGGEEEDDEIPPPPAQVKSEAPISGPTSGPVTSPASNGGDQDDNVGDTVGSEVGGDQGRANPSPSIKQVKKVEAVFSYKARSVDQLSFHKGDVMEILIYRPKGKWWFARLGDKKGWIPHNFVKVLDEDGNIVSSPASNGGAEEDARQSSKTQTKQPVSKDKRPLPKA